jgi:hypothetical protein
MVSSGAFRVESIIIAMECSRSNWISWIFIVEFLWVSFEIQILIQVGRLRVAARREGSYQAMGIDLFCHLIFRILSRFWSRFVAFFRQKGYALGAFRYAMIRQVLCREHSSLLTAFHNIIAGSEQGIQKSPQLWKESFLWSSNKPIKECWIKLSFWSWFIAKIESLSDIEKGIWGD